MSSGGLRTSPIKLARLYVFIARNPGLTPGKIARRRETTRSAILSQLVAMESVGLYVSEDDRARLWPFSCRRYCDH